MIQIQGLTKSFSTPRGKITVLDNFTRTIEDGTFLGIRGKSGAGKSTLLSIIAGLQKPDFGTVKISDGAGTLTDIFALGDTGLSAFRNKHIGFVSQEQSFLENLTVFDNVRLPYFLGLNRRAGRSETEWVHHRTLEVLSSLGISHLAQSYPRDLSGGENHRVLIARSLINNPQVILADEPTESVESERSEQIVGIFRSLAEGGKTVLLVSHDESVLKSCDTTVLISRDVL